MSPSADRAPTASPVVEFRDVTYSVPEGRKIIDGLSFTIERGETLVLLGRSGAGKSTAVRLINRMIDPTSGDVRVEGRSTREWNPIELRRHIGYVIQDVGLFPHYTVEQNISLIPRLQKWSREKTRARVKELLELVGLEHFEYLDRYPHELSGGQRQRIGVARALAADPPVLLMDEPFGALDPLTRGEVQGEFVELQKRLGKTIVVVTHDVGEALLLGTRIGVMDEGKLAKLVSPHEFVSATDSLAKAYFANLRMYEAAERRAEGRL
ncbi:MAG: ATP-binding cassette domain-containing protein [Candidatus Acidiferrales bacterium]